MFSFSAEIISVLIHECSLLIDRCRSDIILFIIECTKRVRFLTVASAASFSFLLPKLARKSVRIGIGHRGPSDRVRLPSLRSSTRQARSSTSVGSSAMPPRCFNQAKKVQVAWQLSVMHRIILNVHTCIRRLAEDLPGLDHELPDLTEHHDREVYVERMPPRPQRRQRFRALRGRDGEGSVEPLDGEETLTPHASDTESVLFGESGGGGGGPPPAPPPPPRVAAGASPARPNRFFSSRELLEQRQLLESRKYGNNQKKTKKKSATKKLKK